VEKFICQLLATLGVNDARQTKVHTAGPFLPELFFFLKIDTAVLKLQIYKLPGTHQTPAELVGTESKTLYSEFPKCLYSVYNKNVMKESIIISIFGGAMKLIAVILEEYHFRQFCISFIQNHSLNINFIFRRNYWGSSECMSIYETALWSGILNSLVTTEYERAMVQGNNPG
jgi:hypothetical protein